MRETGNRFRRGSIRRGAIAVVVAIGALAAVPAVEAGAATPTCPNYPTAQSFWWLLDFNYYFRMPNGGFESSGGWNLSGGAYIRNGSSQNVMPASWSDSHALVLPYGASAKSANICVSGTAPVMRLFARSQFLGGSATVTVTASNDSGETQTLVSPVFSLLPLWSVQMANFRLPYLGDHLTNVTIEIKSAGIMPIEIDDLYIDPLRQR